MVKRGQKYISFVIAFVVFSLFSIQGSAVTFAEGEGTASSTFSIDVSNAVLQLSVPIDASITLNPTSSAGDFGSTNLNIRVSTNNATGYRLSMSVPTTDLTHSTITGSNAPVISTLTSSAPESTFPANAWGYKVVGDNYNPILLNNTPSSWEADGPTNETSYPLTLAAKVDGTKPAGAYQNTLTFQVVANPNIARDIITFNANGGTGTMGDIDVTAGTSTTLPANAFIAPTDYRFSGWSTAQNGQGEGVKYYTDKALYTAANSDVNRQVTLYAQWTNLPCPVDGCPSDPEPDPTTGAVGTTLQRAYEIVYTAMHKGMYEEITPGSNTYQYIDSWNGANYQGEGRDVRFLIQDMTPEICASATAIHSEALVLDIRDQTSYPIKKGADQRCWMTENLSLDLLDSNVQSNMINNPSFTNADSTSINALFFGSQANDGQHTATGVSNWTGSDSYYVPLVNRDSKDLTRADLENPSDNLIEANDWVFGIYYNFCAASAGSYCSGDGYDNPGTAIDSIFDICPSGWRLPTGGAISSPDGGEYSIAQTAYQSGGLRSPFHIPLSGYFSKGTPRGHAYYGRFWSSSKYDWNDMYYIDFHMYYFASGLYTWVVQPQASDARNLGFSIRCINKTGLEL